MINLVSWQPSTLARKGKHFIPFFFLPTKFKTFCRFVGQICQNSILFPGLEKYIQFHDFFLFVTTVGALKFTMNVHIYYESLTLKLWSQSPKVNIVEIQITP